MNMEDQNEELRQLGTTRFQFVYVSVDLILSYHNADQIALINTDAPCQGRGPQYQIRIHARRFMVFPLVI